MYLDIGLVFTGIFRGDFWDENNLEFDFEACTLQDEEFPDSGALTEEELFAEIMKPEEEEEGEDNKEDVERPTDGISFAQAISHCEELRHFLSLHKEDHMFIRGVEAQVKRSRKDESHQTSLDSNLTPTCRKDRTPAGTPQSKTPCTPAGPTLTRHPLTP